MLGSGTPLLRFPRLEMRATPTFKLEIQERIVRTQSRTTLLSVRPLEPSQFHLDAHSLALSLSLRHPKLSLIRRRFLGPFTQVSPAHGRIA
jgi:hypothetical protein